MTDNEKKPRKILAVDDEPDFERLVRQRMRREIRSGTYNFVFAGNGVEALDRLNEQPDIDMVISDINMPEMDGLTLLEQVASVDPRIRCVIVSAYGDMKNIRQAMNKGAFDFVTKPIDFNDLRLTIERTLHHLEMLREALESRDKLVALQNELELARNMQQSILPTEFPARDGYQVFASMEPAQDVGGDFYDVLNLVDNKIGVAVADVSGKGVPAALFMMSSRTLLKGAAIGRSKPHEVLREVNQLLYENNETAMFVTVFFAVYDPKTGEMVYANGGHNPPIVVHADGSSTEIPHSSGIALGMVPDFDYEMSSIVLAPGDTAVLYTDGVTEAENARQEQFGMERLRGVMAESPPADAHGANSTIFKAVRGFAGDAPQFDDITCLVLHRGTDA